MYFLTYTLTYATYLCSELNSKHLLPFFSLVVFRLGAWITEPFSLHYVAFYLHEPFCLTGLSFLCSPTSVLCPSCRIPCSLLRGRRQFRWWLNPWRRCCPRGTCGGAPTPADQGERQGRHVLLLSSPGVVHSSTTSLAGWWDVCESLSWGSELSYFKTCGLEPFFLLFEVARIWLSFFLWPWRPLINSLEPMQEF
jgi:hypothetical protein